MNLIALAKYFENKTASKTTQYVYHLKPNSFKGNIIYPLSKIENEFPSIYKKEINKYKGRESHPETKIKLLNCKWKDCVIFSTLNPIKIFQLEKLLQIPGYKEVDDLEVFRFDIKDLKEKSMCLYDDDIGPKKDEAYSKITISSYKETQNIPIKTVKHFVDCKEKNKYPLLFGNIPHLLVKDEIDISKADIIKI